MQESGWFRNKRGINFETHPLFSSLYLLRGSDEPAIRALFGEDLLTFLEGQEKIGLEGDGEQLVWYRRKRIEMDELQELMQQGYKIAALLRGS